MYKPLFVFLLVAIILLFMAGLRGESNISIDVLPKVAVANPYKSQGFRVLIRIPENNDNRTMSWAADCGANAYSGQKEVDSITYTKFFEMRVVRDCLFVACLYRVENGKWKSYCVHQEVNIPDDP